MIENIRSISKQGLLKIVEIESASCEGIAIYLFHTFNELVRKKTNNRAWLKNSSDGRFKKFSNI